MHDIINVKRPKNLTFCLSAYWTLILPRCHSNIYNVIFPRELAAKSVKLPFLMPVFVSFVESLPYAECYKVSPWLKESLESAEGHSSCKLNA